MCIILPVSHIPCTHTIAIWQHCIEATRFGQVGIKPCWNVKQHEQSVISRRPCEDCSGQRFFARRGGVAERGNGSPTTTPDGDARTTNDDDDDADDSGYHSDVIHEEDEASDRDECPLSPKALASPQPRTKACKQRKRTSSNHRTLTRKPSWKPNLKRELNLEYEPLFPSRRDSIDSLISKFDAAEVIASPMETTRESRGSLTPTRLPRQMRDSTLLHPSSPPPTETTGQARVARAFPFPQMVDVRRSESGLRPRKNSTLLHPSSPMMGPLVETTNIGPSMETIRRPGHVRRESSLLHPSLPAEPVAVTAQHRTIISVPPRQRSATPPSHTLRRMPPLQATQSEPQSASMARQRRASVLHSCLSDDEEGDAGRRETFSFGGKKSAGSAWEDFGRYEQEEAEEMMLRNSARAVRDSRKRS